MIDWKKFISADFWTKKEISYQYVHFTNALFIVLILSWVLNGAWYSLFGGLLAGFCVEAKQWIGGNHKLEDAIRDIVFWTLGGIVGYILYF